MLDNIKGYAIKSTLGKGGMATVYLAENRKFGVPVAIKVLNREHVHNGNIRERFFSEAKLLYRMTHPNIVKATDLIDDGEMAAYVMDYVEGETLKDYVQKKGRLRDEEIRALFVQMLDAVGFVHENQLVHRDIKPSNFMIGKNGKVKLMDFGIVKNLDISAAEYTMTGTTQQMGTPMYMSPEQVKSSKIVSARSDIYSLGVVLWQMITGRKPYDVDTLSTFDIQTKIVNDPLDSTNTEWDQLIEKATHKNPELRYESCVEFRGALNSVSSSVFRPLNKESSDVTMVGDSGFERVFDGSQKNISSNVVKNHKLKKRNSKKFIVFICILVIISIFMFIGVPNQWDLFNSANSSSNQISDVDSTYLTAKEQEKHNMFLKGMDLFDSGEYKKTIFLFEDYKKRYPEDTYGYYWIFRAKAMLDEDMKRAFAINDAISYIQVAESDKQKNKQGLIIAYGYMASYEANIRKDYSAARNWLTSILLIDPNNSEALQKFNILSESQHNMK